MSRIGLGRHGQLDSDVGDPLDGLVNLFDVGVVLAVAFLIAGLALGGARAERRQEAKGAQKTLHEPKTPQRASGQGQPVGQVYRLPDGRLVLHQPSRP